MTGSWIEMPPWKPPDTEMQYYSNVALWKRLHWLPVSSWIQYKLCMLMFDIQHGIASQYLAQLRSLWHTWCHSAAWGNFVVRRTQLCISDEAFIVAGPRAFNALPADIKLTDSCIIFRKNSSRTFLNLAARSDFTFLLFYCISVQRCWAPVRGAL